MDDKDYIRALAFRLALFLPALGSLLIAMNPDSYKAFLNSSPERKVLSQLVAHRLGNGGPMRIVKVREGKKIVVEIYTYSAEERNRPIQKVEFSDQHDGHIRLNEQVTNLAESDVDGDQSFELIVPTFDNQWVARMNVIKYNAATQKFEVVNIEPSL